MTWQSNPHTDGLHVYDLPSRPGAHLYLAHSEATSLHVTVLNDAGDAQASLYLELTADLQAALADALATIPGEGDR